MEAWADCAVSACPACHHAQKTTEVSPRNPRPDPREKQAQFLRWLRNTLLRSRIEKRRRQHQTHDRPPDSHIAGNPVWIRKADGKSQIV